MDNEDERQARPAAWKRRAGSLSAGAMAGTQQLSRNGIKMREEAETLEGRGSQCGIRRHA